MARRRAIDLLRRDARFRQLASAVSFPVSQADERALGLTANPAERALLEQRLA